MPNAMLNFSDARQITDEQLDFFLKLPDDLTQKTVQAMRYSAIGGGKALRPYLILAVGKMFAVSTDILAQLGAAVEMVHTYSLIHDDLPAMDNDDMRRGKPSNHKAFGEATAILAGDGLLTKAFEVLAGLRLDANIKCRLIKELAAQAGASGMIGGQTIDLIGEKADLTLAQIQQMQALKTGAIILFCCTAPAIAANGTPEQIEALACFGKALGALFQITDDLLDQSGDALKMGKTLGKDEKSRKSTLIRLIGVEKTKEMLLKYQKEAQAALSVFKEKAEPLYRLTDQIITREN